MKVFATLPDALGQGYLRPGFSPQGRGVRFEPMEQAGESVVGWCLLLVALYFRRLGRAERARRGNHEVDVVILRALGRIRALFLLHFLQLRNFSRLKNRTDYNLSYAY